MLRSEIINVIRYRCEKAWKCQRATGDYHTEINAAFEKTVALNGRNSIGLTLIQRLFETFFCVRLARHLDAPFPFLKLLKIRRLFRSKCSPRTIAFSSNLVIPF